MSKVLKRLLFLAVLTCTFLVFSAASFAANPIITDIYTADPSARVGIDGRLYLYPSHDIEPGQGCDLMDQYHVYSTNDMVNWVDHGEILRASQVPWGRPEGGFMWAPDCIYKNGTYYYYFPHPSGTDWGTTWKTGIATSTSPASGFTVQGYIPGLESLIDPNVFIDDDGQAYFYYGGGGICKGGKLKANMMEIDGSMQNMTGLVDFHEATWVFKRNGIYYLTYADNHSDATGDNRMVYATSNNPLGPWTYRGIIMDPTDSFCAHGSIVEYQGQWYCFYFNSSISHNDWLRSTCVDRLYFNADGTIQKVVQTTTGVPGINGAVPKPDLMVSDITTTPAYPAVGETVTINAVVKNRGGGAGAAGVVSFKVDGTQFATSANSTASIAAGGTALISATTTWTVTSGNHTLSAAVDVNNTTNEFDENNNALYSETLTPVQVPGKIEAENYRNMSGIQLEGCTDVGGGVNTCFIDTNDWMEYGIYIPTAGSYTINARVASPNNGGAFKLQNNGTDIATYSVPNTGAWQNWTTLSATVNLNAGLQTIRALVTYGGFNINYFDIQSNIPVNKPDLIITDITTSPASPIAGNAVTFSAVVKNQGNVAGAAGAVVFKVNGTQVATVTNTTSIAAGATLTVTGTGTWTATSGTHTLNAVVDNANATSESNETNNSYSESLTVSATGQPDLIVTDITFNPTVPATGNATVFSAVVKNQGSAATPAGTIIGVSFTVNGTQVSWSDTYTSSLAAGATVTLTANGGPSGTPNWTATTGTHTITANVDDVNRIPNESNESNNLYSENLTVNNTPPPSQPDLIVTDITYSPASPAVGNAVTFSAVVKNQGTAAGAAGTVVFKVNGTQVATVTNTTSIAVNGTLTVTGTGTWTAAAGTHTLNAVVDNANTTVESNETNNSYSESLSIAAPGQPDMIVTDITYSPTAPAVGNAVTFSAVVKNNGTVAGAAGVVVFKVNGTQVATVTNTTSIAAGATLTVTGTGTWTAAAGTHTLNAVVDNTNTTAESDETNNSYSESLTIGGTGTPDLVVTDISWSPASPAAGNAVTFSIVVKNQGTGATPGGVVHGVGISIDGGATSLWSDNYTSSIAAGASVTLTVNGGSAGPTWTAVSGTHSVRAFVDDVNRIPNESNETNNQYTENIVVGTSGGNLAQGKSISASSTTQSYVATNANDGNVNTYWEGAANTYPNTLTVDLGSAQTVGKVVLKLNPSWGTRTQTLSVLTSTDNSTYTTRAASATYTFNAGTNTVTITFTGVSARYVRLNITANSGATAGQVAEFEVYNN